MHKWIFVSTSLLPMLLIGCTEHSLDSDISLSNEKVLINFSTDYAIDYEIDVVPAEYSEEEINKTRGVKECNVGIVGIATSEDNIYSDCLNGLSGDSFCNNLYNAEFTGILPGAIEPVDGISRSFPLEENSAVAVYAYSPYVEEPLVIGDTSCYVKLDLIKERMSKDYSYTGKVFRKKNGFSENDKINLKFKHAFAKVEFSLNVILSQKEMPFIQLDSLQVYIEESGIGLLDLKNGNFYPEPSNNEPSKTSFAINEIIKGINEGEFNVNEVKYIPPTITLRNIKFVFRNKKNNITYTKSIDLNNRLNLEKGKEYSISMRLNLSKYLN